MRTQHNFCTQQLRYVGITVIVILFGKSCVQKVCTNSFQEVLEAVLLWGWSIPPTALGWLLCGSPTRVITTFILSVEKILFDLSCISNNVRVWYFDFGGKWETFVPTRSSRVSGSARRILSPTWEYYLVTVVLVVCA